jgi:hypothetical protein
MTSMTRRSRAKPPSQDQRTRRLARPRLHLPHGPRRLALAAAALAIVGVIAFVSLARSDDDGGPVRTVSPASTRTDQAAPPAGSGVAGSGSVLPGQPGGQPAGGREVSGEGGGGGPETAAGPPAAGSLDSGAPGSAAPGTGAPEGGAAGFGSSGAGGVGGESAAPASGASGAGGQDAAGGSSRAGSAAPATGGSLSPDLVEQICGFIRMAGEAPAPAGSEFYAPELDPDGDGMACD